MIKISKSKDRNAISFQTESLIIRLLTGFHLLPIMQKNIKSDMPLRLGVIGTGKISQIILPMLKEYDVSINALTDLNQSAAEALAKDFEGAIVHNSLEALLHDDTVEAVYIATPPSIHREQIKQALAVGKHVICEKPFTMNQQDAVELAKDASAYPGLHIGCCCSRFRYTPMAQAAARIVHSGTLGKIHSVRIFSTNNVPVSLDQLPSWKRQAASAGGGMIADWGTYEIDWLQYVLDKDFQPMEVNASFNYWNRKGTDMDSGYDLHIRCSHDIDVFVSRQPEIGPKKNLVEIRGESGGLDLPFAPAGEEDGLRHYALPDGSNTPEICLESKGTSNWSNVLCGPIINLANAIRQGEAVSSTPKSQVFVHTLLDAIQEAGRGGKAVQFHF